MLNDNNAGKSTKGNVTYNKEIILSVINLATKEIAGVSSLVANFGSGVKKWFSHNYYEGVKISSNNNNEMVVDVYINVYYGYNVSEISYKVQENIKSSLQSMIDVNINNINVHVLGVDFPKEDEIIEEN